MVIGHWSLVIGHWSLVIGHWSLVIGHWSLVIGHWSLVIGKIFFSLYFAFCLQMSGKYRKAPQFHQPGS
ncbi:hypothetical protein [Aphanizomenon flos-aquae]|uniref:hypothetical protein n=1 Tax=Aphanizomenon flos-aquae TaxID=1176 RepID=UPI00190F9895|nr:hypothetical protein [Aphanizomenon flos-aquae]